ncbi:MAG TPA: FUSC family protein [Steroidobacteraceae bacterium]
MVGTRLVDWHEGRSAIRMLAAALGAYLATNIIHLPGAYSAVITTLIVARPHSGGVLRASFERLAATILGAVIACAATFGRVIHTPELLLIGLTLSPLALVAAHNSAYRTAMIAAMIVLSAPATSGAPLHVAGIRMLDVSIGAVLGALVSVTILPSRREVVVAGAIAKLLGPLAGLLRNATRTSQADAITQERSELRIRQALRELGMLIRDRPDAPPTKGLAAAMVKFTVQMHADLTFLKRELHTDEPPPAPVTAALESFARAFEDSAAKVAALARGRPSEEVEINALRKACGEAAEVLRESCARSEGARLMLRRFLEDFGALIHSIERAQPLRPRPGAPA